MPLAVKHLCKEIVKIEGVNGLYTLIKVAGDGIDGRTGAVMEPGEPRVVAKKAGLSLESPVFKGKYEYTLAG